MKKYKVGHPAVYLELNQGRVDGLQIIIPQNFAKRWFPYRKQVNNLNIFLISVYIKKINIVGDWYMPPSPL